MSQKGRCGILSRAGIFSPPRAWEQKASLLSWQRKPPHPSENHTARTLQHTDCRSSHVLRDDQCCPGECKEEQNTTPGAGKDHTKPNPLQAPILQSVATKKIILKVIETEILSWWCSFKSNFRAFPGTDTELLTWHLHPAWAQYRTSESSGDRISFGLITDHKDNGFLLTKISGKPFCCWASNLCLDLDFLLYLKWMHACWS